MMHASAAAPRSALGASRPRAGVRAPLRRAFAPTRDATRGAFRRRSGASSRRDRARLAPRAGWSDFADAVKREVDLTFNPRTRGAKIAGRCPDTQEIPTEIGRAEEAAAMEAEDADFDLDAFTAQLEAQLEAQNAARTVVDVAEEKVNAELAMKLAEVADGYGVAGAVGHHPVR